MNNQSNQYHNQGKCKLNQLIILHHNNFPQIIPYNNPHKHSLLHQLLQHVVFHIHNNTKYLHTKLYNNNKILKCKTHLNKM